MAVHAGKVGGWVTSLADLLLLGMPVALWAAYSGNQPLVAFVASGLAVLRLAAWMGKATEQVAMHAGPRVGGFVSGTFGNAAELIITILAIRAGLYDVVKASITGSIISNALLVLGGAALAGGLRYPVQQFNRHVVRFNTSLMLVAITALAVPAVFRHSVPPVSDQGMASLSLVAALVLLLTYIASLVFSFKTHPHLFASTAIEEKPDWSRTRAFVTLGVATVLVVGMSEVLVGAIEPVLHLMGWSPLFVGVVVVALVGNAAEHSTAVAMAARGKMEIAVEIAIGSSTQIALLVAPVAVLVSWVGGRPMSLEFIPAELVAILMSVLTVNQIARDGETNWLEGVLLLGAYAIIATAFYFIPAH